MTTHVLAHQQKSSESTGRSGVVYIDTLIKHSCKMTTPYPTLTDLTSDTPSSSVEKPLEDHSGLFEPLDTSVLQLDGVLTVFEQFNRSLAKDAKRRRIDVKPCSHIDNYTSKLEEDSSHVITHHTTQAFIGDQRLKNILNLLNRIDERGYERSANQVRFHEAFLSASGRCIYKEEWEVHRRAIMARNGWTSNSSEILVSTPRRFGKTFRYFLLLLNVLIACIASHTMHSASLAQLVRAPGL